MTAPATLPEHLRAIWEEMVPQVSPKIGEVGLEALCVQVHRARDAQRRVTEEGMLVLDAKGNAAPHPALAIEKAAQGEVRTWLLKFGARRAAR